MKILYLNPVGTDKYDVFFKEYLKPIKASNCELHIASLKNSDTKIETIEYLATEAAIAPKIVNAAWKASKEGFDAFIIGCFYDTALFACREVSNRMFVVGPCQASVNLASAIANTFSIVIGIEKSSHTIKRNLIQYGKGDQFLSFGITNQRVSEFQTNRSDTFSKISSAAKKCVDNNKAEAIILGCTLEANYHTQLSRNLNVPVIDPSIAALKTAELLASLSSHGSFYPSNSHTSKIAEEKELICDGVIDENFDFGNRIIV